MKNLFLSISLIAFNSLSYGQTSSKNEILIFKRYYNTSVLFQCTDFENPNTILVNLSSEIVTLEGCAYDDCEGRLMKSSYALNSISITNYNKESSFVELNLTSNKTEIICVGLLHQ